MSVREDRPQDPYAPLIDHTAYRLQIALTDAIARYVRELRRTQFRALTYRGADMGRAIAVELYFRLVNDDALRSAYSRHLNNERFSRDKDDIPLSTEAYWIFRQIIRRAPPGYLHRRLKAYVRLTYNLGRTHLANDSHPLQRQDGPVLILALSRRFFDYLLPIRRALASQVLWLVPAGASWTADLAASGEKLVFFDTSAAKPPVGPLTEPLDAHWAVLATRLDMFQHILDQVKPSAVVVTEGNQSNDELLARAAQTLGIRSVCIQQGWSPIVHAGFRDMQYDAFCAWGPEFARLLQPYNRRQKFIATGSHRVGTNGDAQPSPQSVAFFLQKNSLLITPGAWEQMLAFISWVARTWPDRSVLVREHPAEPLTERETSLLAQHSNIVFSHAAAMPLAEVLRQTAIAVAFYSTTLVEALAGGAVPLIINITGAPRYSPDLEALGAGLEVHDFDAARQAMSRLMSGGTDEFRQKIASLAPRFFAHPTDLALRNIIAAIHDTPVFAPPGTAR